MKKAVLGLFLVLIWNAFASADVPKIVSFQGELTDSTGTRINSSRTVTFKFYTIASAGSELWSEAPTLTPSNGIVSYNIGSSTGGGIPLAFDTQYWIGVTVSPDALEMTPRIRLSTSPYAFLAKYLDTGAVAYGALNVAETVTASKFVGNGSGLTGVTAAAAPDTDWTIATSSSIYRLSGNVGIGTTSPGDSLHVAGRIQMDTNAAASAADGAIRWNGSDFEGRKAGSWVSMTGVGAGGDITGVTAGAGISGGGATGAVTVSVDTSYAHRWAAQQRFDSATAFSDSVIVGDTLLFVNKQTGRIGVGTTSPVTAFTVDGDIYMRQNGSAEVTVLNTATTAGDVGSAALSLVPQNGASQQDIYGVDSALSVRTGGVPGVVSSTERMRITAAGNVGIGKTTPGDSLHVAGRIQMDTNAAASAADGAIRWSGSDFEGRKAGSWVSMTGVGAGGDITGVTAGAGLAGGGASGAVTVSVDTAYAHTWTGRQTFNAATAFSDSVIVSDTVFVVNKQSASVGVGTASPAGTLHVSGPNTLWTNPHIQIDQTSSGSSKIMQSSSGLLFRNFNPTGTNVAFDFRDPTTDLSALAILANKNVGIGSASPGWRLDVSGGARVSDSLVVADTALVVNKQATKVGVGTASPTDPLQVSANASDLMRLTATSGGQATLILDPTAPSNSARIQAVTVGSNAELAFITGGAATERARIDQNGNVGVGITAPGAKLDVAGTAKFSDSVIVSDTALVVNKQSNYVGVGTASPAQTLDVNGTLRVNRAVEVASGVTGDMQIGHRGNQAIDFFTNNTVRMNLSSIGNLSVGTGSPGAKLHVIGNVIVKDTFVVQDTALVVKESGNVGIGTTSPTQKLNVVGAAEINGTVYSSNFQDLENTAYFLDPAAGGNSLLVAGKVGIGDTAPGAKLRVAGDVSISDSLVVGDTRVVVLKSGNVGVGTANPSGRLQISDGEIPSNGLDDDNDGQTDELTGQVVVTNTGNVGIGTTSPSTKLEVAGGLVVDSPTLYVDATNNKVGIGTDNPDTTFSVNGGASKVGGGSWATFSDGRLKNVEGVYGAGTKELMQLTPVRYRYRKDNGAGIRDGAQHIGLVAQEVQAVIPEAVQGNNKGYLMLDNDPVIFAMLNAIKEQKAEIDALRSEIAAMKRGGRE